MAVQKRFETWPLDRLIPYENNPRLNDEAVADVMESIRQTDNLDPIEVDEEGVILSGHTRLKALKKLGYVETDVIIYVGLTDEQKRKYRLLANKTGEKSGWDIEKLDEELANLDFEGYDFGFDLGDDDEDEDDKYTLKVNIPQYEVTGDRPNFADMLNSGKADAMIAEIEAAEGITEEERSFLIQAARRHNVFNYRNIAEYYAHATPEMQQLMERSALVIIDVDNAIANGYARLSDDIMAMMENDNNFQTGGVIWMPEDFKAPKVLNARWKKGAG